MTYKKLKRLLDVITSVLFLLLFLPLAIIVAIAIVIDDGPPIIFTQRRVGYKGKIFNIYKFRTMVRNADKLEGNRKDLSSKDRGDKRITRLGRLLRMTSLDEIPQFINIIKGDMSLIGPRCLAISDADKLPRDRLDNVLPGITGLWQVSEDRWSLSIEEIYELDKSYSRDISLLLDLQITLKTLGIIFLAKNR